jgi:hypothetical protein
MGLDTYVMRAKADIDTFLIKDEYGYNKINESIWKECLYWRKCWGIDNYLSFHSTDKIEDDYRVSLKHCEQLISSSNYILGPTSDTGTIDIPLGITLVSNPTGNSCVKLRYYIKKGFAGSSENISSYFNNDVFKNVKLKFSYSPYL